MEKEYLIIDNHLSKNGNVTTEFKESDGKLLVKQFSGTNTDNFIIKKFNNKRKRLKTGRPGVQFWT